MWLWARVRREDHQKREKKIFLKKLYFVEEDLNVEKKIEWAGYTYKFTMEEGTFGSSLENNVLRYKFYI